MISMQNNGLGFFRGTHVRFGVLEDEEREGQVAASQSHQEVPQQTLGGALLLSLAAVQKGHHPLEGVFHVAFLAGLLAQRHRLTCQT